MKFVVTRTSFNSSSKPCDEAFEDVLSHPAVPYQDERTCGSPAEVPAHKGETDWWYSRGENHRVEHGHIVRDLPAPKAWFVDIEDLPALVRFYKKYGRVIIREASMTNELEIYDADREYDDCF